MHTVVKVILTVPKCLAFVYIYQYIPLRRHAHKEWTGATNQLIRWKDALRQRFAELITFRKLVPARYHGNDPWCDKNKCVPLGNLKCNAVIKKRLPIKALHHAMEIKQ